METGKGRGGRRAGSGRKKKDTRMVSFRAPGELADRLDAQPSRTSFIKSALGKALAEQEAALSSLGDFIPASSAAALELPFYDTRVVAGFPVPLDNDEKSQDINVLKLLCPHPESSYLVRVNGDSMIDAGILSGDIVIVDKGNRNPSPKEIAVCELNGEFTLKHFVMEDGRGWLVPANPDYPKFPVGKDDEFSVWGTVTYIIHKARD